MPVLSFVQMQSKLIAQVGKKVVTHISITVVLVVATSSTAKLRRCVDVVTMQMLVQIYRIQQQQEQTSTDSQLTTESLVSSYTTILSKKASALTTIEQESEVESKTGSATEHAKKLATTI